MKSRLVFILLCIMLGCTPRFQSNVTPIKTPSSYKSSLEREGFVLGFEVLSPEKQVKHFGINMLKADVQPVRVVARNDSPYEYYVQAEQIFGLTAEGDLYPAYRLDQTIERIRQSEIGQAMAQGAAVGLIVGAAIGAGVGAAIGGAAGDSGMGAAIGASTMGAGGGLAGASSSADAITSAIKKELWKVDWGNRVVYPGRIEHGFLFLKSDVHYKALDVLLYNVNKRRSERVTIPIKE